jgi:hypothetical protein
MFLVTASFEAKQERIRQFLMSGEHAVAVLLAAAVWERTVRRAILALGFTPTRELAHRLGRPRPKNLKRPAENQKRYGSGLNGYADAWRDELARLGAPPLKDVVGPMDTLCKALQLRHGLIHGDKGTTGKGYASAQIERILSATKAVNDFASRHGANLEKRLRPRLKPRRVP